MKTTINRRQTAFLIALTSIIALASCLYGIGGAVLLTGISAVIMLIFYRGLSTEAIKQDLEVMAESDVEYFGDFDPWYDPMLSSYSCNIYHQD